MCESPDRYGFWTLSGLCGGGAAVGKRQQRPFELSFNGRLRVDFQGTQVTSDGGLLLVRELDERLGFGELIERHFDRRPRKEHPVAAGGHCAAVGI